MMWSRGNVLAYRSDYREHDVVEITLRDFLNIFLPFRSTTEYIAYSEITSISLSSPFILQNFDIHWCNVCLYRNIVTAITGME